MPERHIKSGAAHGRADRVLVSVGTLKHLSNLLGAEVVPAIDGSGLAMDCLQWAAHLDKLSGQPPARPRAPKGHAIVPKRLLLEAISDINDGANEFEDAAGYCNDTDEESCNSHAEGMRATARKLRRYAK